MIMPYSRDMSKYWIYVMS